MARSLTKSGFAKFMRVHPAQVTRWLERGLPRASDGGINPTAGKEWVTRHIDGTKRAFVHAERGHVQRGVTASRRPPEPAEERDPVSQAIVVSMLGLASKMPAAAATLALEGGAARDEAERIYRLVAEAAEVEFVALVEGWGIECRTASDWSSWSMPEPDQLEPAAA